MRRKEARRGAAAGRRDAADGTGRGRVPGFAAGVLAALLALMAAVTGVIRASAGDGELLAREMLRSAPPAATGLPEAEYAGVGAMTAAFLTGARDTFQYEFTDGAGITRLCFQNHEAAHMADCRELIALDGWACAAALAGLGLCLAAAGIAARRWRRAAGKERPGGPGRTQCRGPGQDGWTPAGQFGRGLLAGLGAALGAAAVLGCWAAVNFDGFFVTFHRVAFDNEGWLLNPRTDLLIRLMPTRFFVSLGIRGLWMLLPAPATLGTAAWALIGTERRRKTSS